MTLTIETDSFRKCVSARDELVLAIRIAEKSNPIGDFAFCAYILNLRNALHYCDQAIQSYNFMIDANVTLEEMKL